MFKITSLGLFHCTVYINSSICLCYQVVTYVYGLILTVKVLLRYLKCAKMAETLFPSRASKLGTQNDNYVKVSGSLQHNKKFLWESRTSFTLWDTVCNLHKQAHAHTHELFCISYKSIWFSSSVKSHFTGSTFLQGCFWYLLVRYVCIPEENNLLSRTPSDTGLHLFLWKNNK